MVDLPKTPVGIETQFGAPPSWDDNTPLRYYNQNQKIMEMVNPKVPEILVQETIGQYGYMNKDNNNPQQRKKKRY